MSQLTAQRCKPCEGGVDPLTPDEARTLLTQVEDWTLSEDSGAIARAFQFSNFDETMAFVNAVAWISRREDHHPDLQVGYRQCVVNYHTHAIAGLSENDFICAAKVNALVA